MNENWSRFLQLGIVHYMSYPQAATGEGALCDTLARLLADEFFDEIEVSWFKDKAERRRAAKLLASSHMPITYAAGVVLMARHLNVNALDLAQRKAAIEQVKACIDEAVELGASRVSLVSGPDPGHAWRQEAMRLFVDAAQDICSYAAQYGLLVLVEPFDRKIDRKALVGPCREAAAVAADVRATTPNFGIMYDQAHMPLLGETIDEALPVLRDYLAHIHVGNCVMRDPAHPAYGDKHPPFGVAEGEHDAAELAAFLRGLFAVGYLKTQPQAERPIVAIEVRPLPGDDPEVVLAATKRVWRAAWSLCKP